MKQNDQNWSFFKFENTKKIGKISNLSFCIKIGIEQSFINIIYVSIPFRIYKNIPQMPINT